MSDTWKGWWFGDRLRYGDDRVPRVGRTHRVPLAKDGEHFPLKLCWHGLHASKHALDALQYAKGTAWRVELIGERVDGDDKSCAYARRYIGRVPDTDKVLREFARYCAIDVLHLWEPPQVVVDYLWTGNEEIWAAASAAAWDAAKYAAGDAANAASAARYAARYAVRYAAWAAANAAWAAAWAAANAAWAAAWDAVNAARYAAEAAQRERLDRMLMLAGLEELDG